MIANYSGDVADGIGIVGKVTAQNPEGKYVSKFFQDSSKVVFTVYKTNSTGATEADVYTIMKADTKGLEADLTALRDDEDSQMKTVPNPVAKVSLVFVGSDKTDIVTCRSMIILEEPGLADDTRKDNGVAFSMKDMKSAEEFVTKLKTVFKSN